MKNYHYLSDKQINELCTTGSTVTRTTLEPDGSVTNEHIPQENFQIKTSEKEKSSELQVEESSKADVLKSASKLMGLPSTCAFEDEISDIERMAMDLEDDMKYQKGKPYPQIHIPLKPVPINDYYYYIEEYNHENLNNSHAKQLGVTSMNMPKQLSVIPSSPHYNSEVSNQIDKVFVDGNHIKNCIAYDMDQGWAKGRLNGNHGPKIYGKVTVTTK